VVVMSPLIMLRILNVSLLTAIVYLELFYV